MKVVFAKPLETALNPPCEMRQRYLIGLNLIWAGRLSNLVFKTSDLADEYGITFVPTLIFLAGFTKINGICGLNDFMAEYSLL
jgi:hypothetical protein